MINIVYGRDEEVAQFIHKLIPHMPTGFSNFKAIGIEKDGALIGGVVFHEYRGNDIQISCASTSKRWLSDHVIRAVFYYPFVQLRCRRVTSFTPKNAANVRRFLLGLGFQEEGCIRQGFDEDDCMVYGMLKNECKWIEEDNG